jgi:hypothetical protein
MDTVEEIAIIKESLENESPIEQPTLNKSNESR